MSTKLTMFLVLGTIKNDIWEPVDLYELINEIINQTILNLKSIPDLLFFEKNITYESVQTHVNKKYNELQLSMVVNADKSVIEPIIEAYASTPQYGINYDERYLFNNISWIFE
jgi:hypothetical protein